MISRRLAMTLLLAMMACSPAQDASRCEDIPASPGFARFDSAGVEVVVNATPAREPSTLLRVAPDPSLTIGVTNGEEA